ncbi:MAG: hypothetical protein EBT45_06730 [Alphaproteobacteria bacterium]|jgi:hypothetical protein|nr:hypothetical protein [Alphaproteobacteria bacterium]
MRNNKAIKSLLAILIISSTASAGYKDEFDTFANPTHKMPALRRAESLFELSQKSSDLAEQCLNEIFLIARGKYGFAKTRPANAEEKTIVAKASAAFKRLFPSNLNPFSGQKAIGDIDESMSDKVTHHLKVLDEGFEHITSLMDDEDVSEIEVFGISLPLSILPPKSTAAPAATVDASSIRVDVATGDDANLNPNPNSLAVTSSVVSGTFRLSPVPEGEEGEGEGDGTSSVRGEIGSEAKSTNGDGFVRKPEPSSTQSSPSSIDGDEDLDKTGRKRSSPLVSVGGGGGSRTATPDGVQPSVPATIVEADADKASREAAKAGARKAVQPPAPPASTTASGNGNAGEQGAPQSAGRNSANGGGCCTMC